MKIQLFLLCALCMLAVVLCQPDETVAAKDTADLKPDDAFYLRSIYNPYINHWGYRTLGFRHASILI